MFVKLQLKMSGVFFLRHSVQGATICNNKYQYVTINTRVTPDTHRCDSNRYATMTMT